MLKNKMSEVDAELPAPKYLELKCTKYCPPGKCKKRKRIFEVRRKPIFNSVLVSECSSEDSSEDSEEITGDDEKTNDTVSESMKNDDEALGKMTRELGFPHINRATEKTDVNEID